MIASVQTRRGTFKVDFLKPIDLGMPLRTGKENVNAFYIPYVTYEPFRSGNFIGDVSKGGSCNVNNVSFNPHGNGTHTETVGHISSKKYPVYKHLNTFFFESRLITIKPAMQKSDLVITKDQLETILEDHCPEAIIIRTLPNTSGKLTTHYSGSNPPYLDAKAAEFLRNQSVKHLLIDLPSVDKEDDGGKLSSHHAFWNYPSEPRTNCTITELIYVPNTIKDGFYLLNLQVAAFDNDAAPSRPVIYALM